MIKKIILFVFLSSVLGMHSAWAIEDAATTDMRVDGEAEGVIAQENTESLDTLKSDNEKMATDKKSLQKMVIHLKHQNDSLSEKIKKQKIKLDALRVEKNKVQKEASKLESTEDQLQAEVSKLKMNNEDLQKHIDGTKMRIKLANQAIAKAKKDQKILAQKKGKMEKTLSKLKAQEKQKLHVKKTVQSKTKSLEKKI